MLSFARMLATSRSFGQILIMAAWKIWKDLRECVAARSLLLLLKHFSAIGVYYSGGTVIS